MSLASKIYRFTREAYLLSHFPSIWKLVLYRRKTVLYYGFLGDGNFGDELVFQATKRLFSSYLVVPYKKRMPFLLKLFIDLDLVPNKIMVIGGGTLIGKNFWKTCHPKLSNEINYKYFLHGTGVVEEALSAEWKSIIPGAKGGIRGQVSKKNLHMQGLDSPNIIGDAALYLFSKPTHSNKKIQCSKVLINVGTHGIYNFQDLTRKELIIYLKELEDKGLELCFLPLHNNDLKEAVILKSYFASLKIYPIPSNLEECKLYFEDVNIAIGERLHFVVCAVMFNKDFISINYSQKHLDFLESVGLRKRGIRPDMYVNKTIFQEKELEVVDWAKINEKINEFKLRQENEKEEYLRQFKK